jgi:hypothetical protein
MKKNNNKPHIIKQFKNGSTKRFYLHSCYTCTAPLKIPTGKTKIGIFYCTSCKYINGYIDNAPNLIGMRTGKLVVKELLPRGTLKRGRAWRCECDCGAEKILIIAHLSGKRAFKSCGCSQYIGGKQNAKPPGVAAFNQRISQYRFGAIKRNLEFQLTVDQCYKLFTDNCFYCGIEPRQITTITNKSSEFVYNGIDRLDNLKGYELDNVVTCCKWCNRWKNSLTKLAFLAKVKAIYEHLNLNQLGIGEL